MLVVDSNCLTRLRDGDRELVVLEERCKVDKTSSFWLGIVLKVDRREDWASLDACTCGVLRLWFISTVLVCGELVNTFPNEMLVCARIFVEARDWPILVVSIILMEPLEACTVFKFGFIGLLVVLLINLGTFDDTGNDKELEKTGLSSRVCSLRPGSPWLA